MKAEKMRGMDSGELQRNSLDAQEQLFRLRFQMGMGSSEGLKKYRSLRKDRARMLTVLNEKAPANKAPANKAKSGETPAMVAAKAALPDKKKKK